MSNKKTDTLNTLETELRWDDPKWWPARCPKCGWEGMSNETEGGHQIADTGDYNDPVCPKCCHSEEGKFMGDWVPVEEILEPNSAVSCHSDDSTKTTATTI